MKSRITALLLCAGIGLLAIGCGSGAAPADPLAHTRANLILERSQVLPYARAFAAAAQRSRFQARPVQGAYRPCPAGKGRVAYQDTITVTANTTSVSDVTREITGILRSEGWRLVNVDFAKVHLALADTNHPLYDMSQDGMNGAANILGYGNATAGAIVFMHSQCVDAGSLATAVERGAGI